ncbi:MAG: hypothetical protein HFH86_01185 [Bacilli bacterium]|nr:hypothetical protein [Bacilli bacterium]
MGHFIKDIFSFLKTLSTIDFILYFAVLILMILIISLIYVIKNSEEGEKELTSDEPELLDLQTIVDTIDENPQPVIDMTTYEAEQEEKAIISYDELIKSSKREPIHYAEEELVDNEIKVKKVNLNQLAVPISTEELPKVEVKLFHYEKEEAFLNTLKQLNELLN